MCLYCGINSEKCQRVCSRQITDQADKDAIVAKHNDLRRKVAKGLERQGMPVIQGHLNMCNSFDLTPYSGRWWRAALCQRHVRTEVEQRAGSSCAEVGRPMRVAPRRRESKESILEFVCFELLFHF